MKPAGPSRVDEGPEESPALAATLSYDNGRAPGVPGATVPPALARGTSVHRYIILDRVGEGGMGVVYAAYDPSLDRRVALKFLASHDSDRDGVRAKRLLREAQAMARLSHPNVAVAYEVGIFEGHVFLAMEFVDGVDLRTWLADKPRPFSRIMDVFHAAGRGLAAAHEAGIVHRDFKPENVLLDKRDRPRVTDFGLSRATHDPGEDDPEAAAEDRASALSAPSHLSSPLTRTGGVLGTPSYMPPEQRAGGVVDARSDQYSFCVALYEALHGEYPSAGDPAGGQVASVSPQSSVPRWCRQALQRGLDPEPANRFASMEALLAALSPHPMSRRRMVAIAASLAVIVGGLGVYAAFFARAGEAAGPRCDLGSQRLAGTWDPARKLALRDAFLRSGARGADSTWKSFSSILDGRASAWAEMYDEACAATHVRGAQSPAVLDLRMECLDRRRLDMKALVDVYSDQPDPGSLDRAASAADKLPSISACADVANLRAVVPLPDDPAARAKVRSLRKRVSHERALYDAGRYEQGRAYMESLKRETDAVGYAPLAAEVAHAFGTHLTRTGKYEESEKVLFDAARQAVKGRDWRLEADILATLIGAYGDTGRITEGVLTARLAELTVERAGGDELLRGRLANNLGGVENAAGHLEEALRQFQRAEELWRKPPTVTSPRYATIVDNIGSVLVDLGRTREGLDQLQRALALRRSILRPDHPEIARSLHSVGDALVNLGQLEKARDAFQSALAIREQELGIDHDLTAATIRNLGLAEAYLGNFDRAFVLFEKALPIQKRALGEHSLWLSSTYLLLGEAQRHAGLYDAAERTVEQVIEHNARAGSPDHLTTGDALKLLGRVHNARRLHARAIRDCRRGLAIVARELGPDNIQVLDIRECIGEALIAARDFDGARKELERAVASIDKVDLGPQWTAGVRFQLARALWATPAERPRARDLARTTLDALTSAEGDNRRMIARITAWLRTHGQR